jgi:hypothetical protein
MIDLNPLHISVTFCGHLQENDFSKNILERQQSQCTDIKY